MNRRKFCLSSLAAAMSGAAVGAVCPPGAQRAAPPAASTAGVHLYKFIYDHRYATARAFGMAAEQVSSAGGTAAIEGDITALWSRDLKARWGSGVGAIAGMTTARTLLCLEQLARDHWMRVTIRAEHARFTGHGIAHRLTAPQPMIAFMQGALCGEGWAGKLPAALAACPNPQGTQVTRAFGPARPPGIADEALVSFVIA